MKQKSITVEEIKKVWDFVKQTGKTQKEFDLAYSVAGVRETVKDKKVVFQKEQQRGFQDEKALRMFGSMCFALAGYLTPKTKDLIKKQLSSEYLRLTGKQYGGPSGGIEYMKYIYDIEDVDYDKPTVNKSDKIRVAQAGLNTEIKKAKHGGLVSIMGRAYKKGMDKD